MNFNWCPDLLSHAAWPTRMRKMKNFLEVYTVHSVTNKEESFRGLRSKFSPTISTWSKHLIESVQISRLVNEGLNLSRLWARRWLELNRRSGIVLFSFGISSSCRALDQRYLGPGFKSGWSFFITIFTRSVQIVCFGYQIHNLQSPLECRYESCKFWVWDSLFDPFANH